MPRHLLIALASAAFLALPASTPAQVGVRDTTRAAKDSAGGGAGTSVTVGPRKERRKQVTGRDSATAYRDPQARAMIARAREARLQQDSALRAYDAMSYGRVSAGMAMGKVGRERLLYRSESASRVRWSRDRGVWIEVMGQRRALPMIPHDAKEEREEVLSEAGDMSAIPYFPGSETLFIGGPQVRRAARPGEEGEDGIFIVHPLGEGAEAYYTYATGDSASFRLPTGRTVRIREVQVRPRETKWNVAVGSLWFDADRGTLVRAAYRMAEPIDLWVTVAEEEPEDAKDLKWVKRIITPMKAQVRAVAVEYGLHEGRFWLPRLQYAEGDAQAGFIHVPFKMEQTFRYASVNGADSIPAITIVERPDEVARLDTMSAAARRAWRDSVRTARRAAGDTMPRRTGVSEACDTSTTGYVVQSRYRYGDTRLPVAVRVPCDVQRLAASPVLPASIYDPGEEVFGVKEREELIAQAISLGAQPAFGVQPPQLMYGIDYLRYNRVEGLSVGAEVQQSFGAGYEASLTARFGFADRDPVVELFGRRSDLLRTVRLGGYHRLVAVGDRGNPLSLGSSLSAMLWGRDEGFYYRATGAELGWLRDRGVGGQLDLRLFGERQATARVRTTRALVRSTDTPWNVQAEEGMYAGGALRWSGSHGLDPLAFRLLRDVRLEGGARADSDGVSYGRLAADLTLSHGIGRVLGHQGVAALTAAAGTSVGHLPTQRWWYLGGLQTVRGQAPGTAIGDAYWLGRAEMGWELKLLRPTIFGDLGWAGDRRDFTAVGRPLSGVGVGASFMDGMIRMDVARGIHPGKQVRVDLSLESRF
jgi:hypothetical protein